MRRFILSSVLTLAAFVLMAVNVLADSTGPGV
jgi:heme/copper-type cytochrome/quinol oxidase subunit 4